MHTFIGKVTCSGIVGGGQFGYNWVAAPNSLLGVEADVSRADPNGAAKDRVGTKAPAPFLGA